MVTEKLENVLVLKSSIIEIFNDIKKIGVTFPTAEQFKNFETAEYTFTNDGLLSLYVEDRVQRIKLVPIDRLDGAMNIAAYDESISKYSCLEGTGYLTAHAIVLVKENDYQPAGLLNFSFYTRSREIVEKSTKLKYSNDAELEMKREYILDKIDFLVDKTPPDSLLLIDGPLIAGDFYTYMIAAVEKFLEKNIIPLYFVKNSQSNLVTENIKELKQRYNSDLHWAYKFLKRGERTNFFKYTDQINPKNSKIFCYIKAFDKSPQRIEFHVDVFDKYSSGISQILNYVYYLILAQGEGKNPQVRTIAIAELFAREFIKLSNTEKYFFNLGLVPTMNQERFGG